MFLITRARSTHRCFSPIYFLLKSNANGVSREDIINRLGITETFFNEFLQGKVAVDLDFAKKLGDTTGIPHDFWLRIQRKFDDTHCD